MYHFFCISIYILTCVYDLFIDVHKNMHSNQSVIFGLLQHFFFFDLYMFSLCCKICCGILLSAVEYALKKSRWNFVLGCCRVSCVDAKRVCAAGVIRKTVSVFCRDPRQSGKEKSLI